MIFMPNVMETTLNGATSESLMSKLFEARIIFLFSEITDDLSSSIIAQLIYLDSISHEDITIYINSPGGSITAGFAIYDTMKYIKSDVRTICVGMAASMASILLASGTKGKRFALKNADVLIHQPLGGVQGQASDIIIVADRIKMLRDKTAHVLEEATGKDYDTIMKDIERDNYLTSEQALDYHLIDEII